VALLQNWHNRLGCRHPPVIELEASGLIERYVARLGREALGLSLEVFVDISLHSQSQESLEAFEIAVTNSPAILECHLMAGQADFLLRVAARSVDDFDQIHRQTLAKLPGVSSMHSSFVLRSTKTWQGYPVAPG